MAPTLTFYGATRTVTGSRHLLTLDEKHQVLIDCGLFQGSEELREANVGEFPFDPRALNAVVITHAHIDHIGQLPKLVAEGFKGPIYATPATIGLAKLTLPDSGRLQEEDARHQKKHGFGTGVPLYTEGDAYACLKKFEPISYHTRTALPGGASFQYFGAGHILGSAMVEIALANGEILLMGGDLGRYNAPIIRDPETVEYADYLVIESTYGDRVHPSEDPLIQLERVLADAWQSGGTVLIPSFAIGRTQELLFYIKKLQDQNKIGRFPIYIDSPMAVSATRLYREAKEEFDQDMLISVEEGHSDLEPSGVTFVRDREQSKGINAQSGPQIIIAGSGMANGGRILHHLLRRLSNPSTIVLFSGYQASGTLGRRILEGSPVVKVLGNEVEVRARVEKINALSAHAGQDEMMRWLSGFTSAPKKTLIVHGEPPAQDALAAKIESDPGWKTAIPEFGDWIEIGK